MLVLPSANADHDTCDCSRLRRCAMAIGGADISIVSKANAIDDQASAGCTCDIDIESRTCTSAARIGISGGSSMSTLHQPIIMSASSDPDPATRCRACAAHGPGRRCRSAANHRHLQLQTAAGATAATDAVDHATYAIRPRSRVCAPVRGHLCSRRIWKEAADRTGSDPEARRRRRHGARPPLLRICMLPTLQIQLIRSTCLHAQLIMILYGHRSCTWEKRKC